MAQLNLAIGVAQAQHGRYMASCYVADCYVADCYVADCYVADCCVTGSNVQKRVARQGKGK
jgi:hypothetical protein